MQARTQRAEGCITETTEDNIPPPQGEHGSENNKEGDTRENGKPSNEKTILKGRGTRGTSKGKAKTKKQKVEV